MNWLFWIVIFVGLLLLPLAMEYFVVNGFLGITFSFTEFGNEEWFSFWGSYIGTVVTVIVLWITIRYNRSETDKRLKEYDIDRVCDTLIEKVETIYSFIVLKDIPDTMILYKIKIDAGLLLSLIEKSSRELKDSECQFFLTCTQVLKEYLDCTNEFEGVKLTNDNIAGYAEQYKAGVKKVNSIMHSRRSQIDEEYIKIKDVIEDKRKEEKKRLYTEDKWVKLTVNGKKE